MKSLYVDMQQKVFKTTLKKKKQPLKESHSPILIFTIDSMVLEIS